MFKFRLDLMLCTAAAICLFGVLGQLVPSLHSVVENLKLWTSWSAETGASNGAIVLAILGTALRVGYVTAARRSLPRYGGAPPLKDLLVLVIPYLVTAVLALAAATWVSGLLSVIPEAWSFRYVTMQLSRLADLGVVCWCLYMTFYSVRDYRQECEWDRNMNPHLYAK